MPFDRIGASHPLTIASNQRLSTADRFPPATQTADSVLVPNWWEIVPDAREIPAQMMIQARPAGHGLAHLLARSGMS
jgi:hypothetical protein